jgi:hypothetical protein
VNKMFDINDILGNKCNCQKKKNMTNRDISKSGLLSNFNSKKSLDIMGGNTRRIVIGDKVTSKQRVAIRKDPFGNWDKDMVINGLDCQPKNKRKHMAEFSVDEEKQLRKINFNKDQKGKYLGHGYWGNVYEVKDNPEFVIKVDRDLAAHPKNNHGQKTVVDKEYHKYDAYLRKEPLAIPTYHTSQGIVRPKISPITSGKDISDEETRKVIDQVDRLSKRNINVGDDIQLGRTSKGQIFQYDLGEINSPAEEYRRPGVLEDNKMYKAKMLDSLQKKHLSDYDADAESQLAVQQIKNPGKEYYDIKVKTPVAREMRDKWSRELSSPETLEYNRGIKRAESTMRTLKHATEMGTIDPIPVQEKDFMEGKLSEGKHRIIVAEQLNTPEVKVRVYPDEKVVNKDV